MQGLASGTVNAWFEQEATERTEVMRGLASKVASGAEWRRGQSGVGDSEWRQGRMASGTNGVRDSECRGNGTGVGDGECMVCTGGNRENGDDDGLVSPLAPRPPVQSDPKF